MFYGITAIFLMLSGLISRDSTFWVAAACLIIAYELYQIRNANNKS